MNISYKKREIYRTAVLCFFLVVVLFAVIQAISGLYPFGSKYNLIWDEDIQYVDFFSFYKDVLLGKADIGYSFSKSAGGSLIALFGYYLGSPLNLLVVFFEKEQIPMFLFFLTAVKLGLCGFTAHIFFRRRFPQLSVRMAVMLSCSYGLMQYNILQCSNVMWLDGVLLLPLILLSVYEFLEKDKKAGLFWTIFLSITISWYTGYMTGIFSVLYFFYERLLKIKCFDKKEGKKFLIDTIRCGSVMFSGLLASCFLFYPVYVGLKKGKAVFDASIFQYAVHGSFIDIFRGFAAGGMASTVSLYCGLIFLAFFFIILFHVKLIEKKKSYQ